MKVLRNTVVAGALLGVAFLAANIGSEPARTISVGGILSAPDGSPLGGEYHFRVQILGSTGDTVLDTAETSATLTAGTFNLEIPVSDKTLDQEALRYRVWADVDRDGLTESDRFPETFKLTAVARAHRGSEPLLALRPFVSHAVPVYSGAALIGAVEVPGGGVRFNTLSVHAFGEIQQSPCDLQLGVYSTQGELLATATVDCGTRIISGNVVVQVVVPVATLPAGNAYFAAASNCPGNNSLYCGTSLNPWVLRYPLAAPLPLDLPQDRLPAELEGIAGYSNREKTPAILLEYLPEAEALPPGSFRWSDQADPAAWNPPPETFY